MEKAGDHPRTPLPEPLHRNDVNFRSCPPVPIDERWYRVRTGDQRCELPAVEMLDMARQHEFRSADERRMVDEQDSLRLMTHSHAGSTTRTLPKPASLPPLADTENDGLSDSISETTNQ